MAHPPPMARAGTEAPLVRLELRHGAARPAWHDIGGEEFLIGSVPGCDMRIPGANLPPIICQVVRRADGVRLRKLAPTQPVFLNGQPVVTQADLAHGDTIQIGAVELIVHLALPEAAGPPRRVTEPVAGGVAFVPLPASPTYSAHPAHATPYRAPASALPEPANVWQQYQHDVSQFRDQVARFEEQRRSLEAREKELESDRVIWYRRRDEVERECQDQRAAVEAERHSLAAQQQQLQADARQVQDLRLQVQNREKQLESQLREFASRVQMLEPRLNQLEAREQALAAREAKIAAEQQAVQQMQSQYQGDLMRIDRHSAGIEQREQEMRAKSAEVERRYEQMQRDVRELEEQARLLDGGQVRLKDEAERLTRQKSEQEALAASLAERTATLEGQQAMLASLRTRLERMRDELRQQAQLVATERAKQEEFATQLREKLEQADKLRNELDLETQGREQERASFDERSTALQNAVARMRQLQEKLEGDDRKIQERAKQLDAQGAEQAEQAGLLRARAQQIVELQQRVEADRQSIRERESALAQAEEARKALQEQLLRRGEELTTRAKAVEEVEKGMAGRQAELARVREQLETDRSRGVEQLETLRQEIEGRSAEIQRLSVALTQREDNLRRQVERLKEAGQTVAMERKSLFEAKARWEADQAATAEQIARARAELETFRANTLKQAGELTQALPEMELRSQGTIERLSQSRDQLKGHLQELHTYARQSQEDLQELRTQVQAEADRLRQQELALHRARSEHRLSVTNFRQQLIDWQGRVADMKQFFTQHEGRLDLKQQAVEQAAKEIDESTRQLAKQAETLQQRDREVTERKAEVERHLGDMRDWYRRKLRDLAGGPPRNFSGGVLEMPAANAVNDPAPPRTAPPVGGRDILSLTGDVEPADRKLGELMLQLGLVDQEMLIPLWNEARRQRRSLRQVLLTSGTITLYQMALIEAGNVDGLMLGKYRVIDRVQATPRELLYRVFDPDRSTMALLRHLAEAEMADAIHPDEYRQRFAAAAAVAHPNLSATYEVLAINERPAVLQEWVSGIATPDWPAFAAAPGVWYRLLGQAGVGMQEAHKAGLSHGHLAGHSAILTADGVLKLTGFGEPGWVIGASDPEDGVVADLQALGRLACDWSMLMPKVKRGKPRPLPEGLQSVIRRLGAPAFAGLDRSDNPIMIPPFDHEDRYPSVAAMLEDLEQAGAELPPNAEAWDRLLKHVGDNATEGAALRRTA